MEKKERLSCILYVRIKKSTMEKLCRLVKETGFSRSESVDMIISAAIEDVKGARNKAKVSKRS